MHLPRERDHHPRPAAHRGKIPANVKTLEQRIDGGDFNPCRPLKGGPGPEALADHAEADLLVGQIAARDPIIDMGSPPHGEELRIPFHISHQIKQLLGRDRDETGLSMGGHMAAFSLSCVRL